MFPQIFAEVLHELDTNEWFGSGDDAEPGNVNSQVKALLRGRCASLERTQFTLPGGMQVRGQVWILRNEKNWGKASREEITQEIGGWPSANVNSLRKTNHLGELKQLLQ